MRFAAWYLIAVGVLKFGHWALFLVSGRVAELQTEPFRFASHLLGEGVTATAALGTLTYTVLVSPRYFAQFGQWPTVAMFSVLLLLTLLSYGLLDHADDGWRLLERVSAPALYCCRCRPDRCTPRLAPAGRARTVVRCEPGRHGEQL